MKSFILSLVIILLFIPGCTKNNHPEPVDTTKTPPHEVYTADIIDTKAPKYFVASATMPDGSLFGVSGTTLTTWNPANDEIKTIGSAWSGMVSPNAAKIAFTDDQGLQILDVVSGSVSPVEPNPTMGDSSLALGVWSPDSGKFMYMFVREWSSDYFIYNVETEEKKAYEFVNIPNFLSRPVDWHDNGLLFAVHANKSKSGEQEYRESGYRSDLMLADIEGNFTPITELDDGQFALYCGTTSDNQTMLVVIWEGESKTTVGLLNTGDGKIDFISAGENTVGGSIGPDGKFAILTTATEGGRFSVRVFDLQSSIGILEKELAGYEQPRHFMWSDDGRTVAFGLQGDDENGILYT
ncbi:MAG: hypothetical protein WCY82_06470, partial [Desulfotomaculaceae bacterium]